jgi:hypothetical protein
MSTGIIHYTNMVQNLFNRQENFNSFQVGSGTTIELTKPVMVISLLIDLLITYLFIMFAVAYINEIHPTLFIKNKSLYIILVYVILIVNSLGFFASIVNLFRVLFY